MRQRFKPREQQFFAELYRAVKDRFPLFSSRDLRNIQKGVDPRVMDFDLPAEWLDDHRLFFRQEYDTKKGMLVEAMKGNMKGLSFAEIRLQEAVRYLDNLARIQGAEQERMVEQEVIRMEIFEEARNQMAKGMKD